ncbi:hypothetical protein ACH50_02790 [Franconibacter pulveris]|uniref:Uncharacterized protein n=1 Tax=Franconibacter pulveris TaxID=435910 RepID=A0A0J8VTL0_9ENTR|nr:hypothetical protein ACH50_02790 [Franconibacter pulveris]
MLPETRKPQAPAQIINNLPYLSYLFPAKCVLLPLLINCHSSLRFKLRAASHFIFIIFIGFHFPLLIVAGVY